MKGIYEFFWDCGRMGEVSGLFLADKSDVEKLIGNEVYFGEILGKHSEVSGIVEEKDIVLKTDDQDFINKLIDIFGADFSTGYNPLDYFEPEEEDEEDYYDVDEIDFT
jgi:hypothetical protein